MFLYNIKRTSVRSALCLAVGSHRSLLSTPALLLCTLAPVSSCWCCACRFLSNGALVTLFSDLFLLFSALCSHSLAFLPQHSGTRVPCGCLSVHRLSRPACTLFDCRSPASCFWVLVTLMHCHPVYLFGPSWPAHFRSGLFSRYLVFSAQTMSSVSACCSLRGVHAPLCTASTHTAQIDVILGNCPVCTWLHSPDVSCLLE